MIQSILSGYNEIKLEISNMKIPGKSLNTWKLNNAWVKKEVSKEILKKYIELNKNEKITYQNLWDAGKAEREIYSSKNLH